MFVVFCWKRVCVLKFLREVNGTLVLPVTILPTTNLLLHFKRSSLLNVPFVTGTNGTVFTGLTLVFTVKITVKFTGSDGKTTTLSNTVNFLMLARKTVTVSRGVGVKMLNNVVTNVVTKLLCGHFRSVGLPS